MDGTIPQGSKKIQCYTMKGCWLLGLCFLLTPLSSLYSQDRSTSDWVVPSMNQGDLLLFKQASLPNQSMKLEVLSELTERWKRGELSPGDRSSLFILQWLAEEGVFDRTRAREPRNFPEVRRKAAYLLGAIGGSEARAILRRILLHDPEPMVVAEAIHALRRSPLPLTPEEVAGLLGVFSRQVKPKLEANLAYAALLLLKDNPLGPGSPFASELFSHVLAISDLPFPNEVKELANEVIQGWIQPSGH